MFASVNAQLERGTSRVVVVIASAATASAVLNSIRDTRFEWIFLDPLGSRADIARLNLAGIFRATAPGVPRGFFAISPNDDVSNFNALSTRMSNFNATLFASQPVDADVVSAYDMVFMIANAWKDVFNAGGNVDDVNAVRSVLFAAPRAYVSSYTFASASSSRPGDHAILNLRVTNFTGAVATWVAAGTWNGAATIAVGNSSALVFADGTSVVPPSQQRASITIALVWPTFRPSHASWRLHSKIAVDDINANGTILPNGIVLRSISVDNFDSASATISAGQDAISRGVVGIIGPSRSTQSIALQYYIGGISVPAISFASTADSLSDKVNYPTFFRTVVRDSLQSKAMTAMMLNRGWKTFCMVNFNDDYGSSVAAAVVAEAQALGIQLVGRSIYSSSTTDFDAVVDPIVAAECKIVVAVVDTANWGFLMRNAKTKGIFGQGHSEYVWIFAEIFSSVMNRAAIEGQNLTVTDFHGTILTQPAGGPPESPIYQRFIANATRLGAATLAYGSFAYDAVWAMAIASGNALRGGRDPTVDRASILGNLRNISFEGASGPVQFDKFQDRVGGIYGIYNFRYWTANPDFVGSWTNTTGVVFREPIIYGDNTTTVPVDKVVVVLPSMAIKYATAGGGIISALAVLFLIIFIITGAYMYHKSLDEKDQVALGIVRKSSPFFMGIILLGLGLATISVFFWFSTADGPSGSARCHLRVWFGFMGAAIAYSALLAKNWRVFYLFNEPSLRVIAITNNTLLAVLGAVVSPLVIILVLWSALAPFQEVLQPNAANTLAYYTCASANDKIFAGISFAYMGVLLVFGSILSWKTRALPDVFKESQYIALATYNILFVTAVGVLIGFIVAFEPPAYTFITVGCILVGAGATWALIFVNKFYIMKYGPPSSRTSPGPGSPAGTNYSLSYKPGSLGSVGTMSSHGNGEDSSSSTSSDHGYSASSESQKQQAQRPKSRSAAEAEKPKETKKPAEAEAKKPAEKEETKRSSKNAKPKAIPSSESESPAKKTEAPTKKKSRSSGAKTKKAAPPPSSSSSSSDDSSSEKVDSSS